MFEMIISSNKLYGHFNIKVQVSSNHKLVLSFVVYFQYNELYDKSKNKLHFEKTKDEIHNIDPTINQIQSNHTLNKSKDEIFL